MSRLVLSVILLSTLTHSGCLLAVGSAAAGGAAYAYYRGCYTEPVPADFATTWHATREALTDLGLPVTAESREGLTGLIESKLPDGDKVAVQIKEVISPIPNSPHESEVGVRVALFGDEKVSRRIVQQIQTRAAGKQHVPGAYLPATAMEPANERVAPPPVAARASQNPAALPP
jgi:hypothetical protein